MFSRTAQCPPGRPPHAGPGFTLMELLCVITIIGVLAAILFPCLRSVRRTSQMAVCVSNYRQIGTAILTYASDHKGYYPGPISVEQESASYSRSYLVSPSTYTIHYYLKNYLELVTPTNASDSFMAVVMLCPAWNAATDKYDVSNGYKLNAASTYASELFRVNPLVVGDTAKQKGPTLKVNTITNPATSWVVQELFNPTANNPEPKPFWHGLYYNAVYADGHVQTNMIPKDYR